MQCISKEDGNIVLLHQGKIGNKLRRLIKYTAQQKFSTGR